MCPPNHQWGGKEASTLQSWLTSYDPVADGLYSHPAQAQFAATTMQQAREARLEAVDGRRHRAHDALGTWFGLSQSTLDSINWHDEEQKEFFVTAVRAMGINNPPKDLSDTICQDPGRGPLQALLQATQDNGIFERHDVGPPAANQGSPKRLCQSVCLRHAPQRALAHRVDGRHRLGAPRPRATASGPTNRHRGGT